jgi:hypothetical protein
MTFLKGTAFLRGMEDIGKTRRVSSISNPMFQKHRIFLLSLSVKERYEKRYDMT